MRHRTWPCLLIFTLVVIPPAAAQTTLSFRGGVSLATVGGDDSEGAETRTGFNLGGAVTFAAASNVGILLGGAYAQKGASVTEQGVQGTLELSYIEVPLMLSFRIPTTGPITPRFAAGGAVSFEASCSLSASAQGASASVDCGAADIPTKSIDFGIIGGAGLDIATSGLVSITLDVLYNLGLSSIDDSSIPGDIKNRAWSILAGIAFPIGPRVP